MQKVRVFERWMRAAGNHRRIEIPELLDKNPELSVSEISEKLLVFKYGVLFYGQNTSQLAAQDVVQTK